MIRINWQGYYLDGKTAEKQAAEIQLLSDGLQIVIAKTGAVLSWPYQEIRQTQGFYKNEPVRLERGGAIPEVLLIDDDEFLTSLHRLAPKSAKRFHNPAFRSLRLRLTVYAAVGIVAAAIFSYVWGIPFLVQVITPRVPLEWEKGMGESILNIMAPKERRCENQELQQAIDEIVARLNTSSPSPYSFKVYIVKSSVVNAIALPGGNIIVFSGLIDKTESPEALAAVLAHEIQHIKLRHATKKIIEDSSTGLILSALSGDLTGSMMYGISAARTLAVLSYSRQDEEAADDGGMKMMMAANLNPEDMIKLFKTIKDENKNIKIPKYISTHPDLDNRIADLKIMTAQAKAGGHVYQGLSSDSNWEQIKKGCNETCRERIPTRRDDGRDISRSETPMTQTK